MGAYMRWGRPVFNLTKKMVSVLHKELECSRNRLLTVMADHFSVNNNMEEGRGLF